MRDTRTLPADAASVRQARDVVTVALLDAGCTPTSIEVARLLVSELATNVVLHTTSADFVLGISIVEPSIRIVVADDDPRRPSIGPAGGHEGGGGRGLQIIDALADQWDVEPRRDRDGKSVWFDLTCA
jgi:anti-sigma regulatory factor (Ser/Thr protein kinase)